MNTPQKIDPYQILFSLGIISSVLGVSLWFFFQMRWISFFPGLAHGHLMFTSFLWPFVAGFVMTAIPRMTKGIETQFFELFVALLFVFLQWVLNVRNLTLYSEVVYLFQVLFLGVFVLRRYLETRRIPFEGFVFFPFAFFITLFILGTSYFYPNLYHRNGLFLSAEAFVLNLIVGLGSRLIPVLSRVPQNLNPRISASHSKMKWLLLTALILNFSYFLELFNLTSYSYSLRAIVLIFVSVKFFDLFKKPSIFTYLGFGLRASVLLLILSYSLIALFPENPKNIAHLGHIGGLALLTLMVATRVRLAHGGFSLDHEIKSPKLLIVVVGVLLSMLLRLSVFDDYSSAWIAVTVFIFSFSVLFWLFNSTGATSKS